jgi:hypothetical protein
LPVGSTAWKCLYHRARNASEARNATIEHWNLKRLPVNGGLRGKAFVYLARYLGKLDHTCPSRGRGDLRRHLSAVCLSHDTPRGCLPAWRAAPCLPIPSLSARCSPPDRKSRPWPSQRSAQDPTGYRNPLSRLSIGFCFVCTCRPKPSLSCQPHPESLLTLTASGFCFENPVGMAYRFRILLKNSGHGALDTL